MSGMSAIADTHFHRHLDLNLDQGRVETAECTFAINDARSQINTLF